MKMKNNTPSEIIIEMKDIDSACNLFKALLAFGDKAGQGGDVHLTLTKDKLKDEQKVYADSFHNCGMIGHDVNIITVRHKITEDK